MAQGGCTAWIRDLIAFTICSSSLWSQGGRYSIFSCFPSLSSLYCNSCCKIKPLDVSQSSVVDWIASDEEESFQTGLLGYLSHVGDLRQ